jgi:hypothetical protein
MIPSGRSWRPGYATAGTLKRIVAPSAAARAPKPIPRVLTPVRPLHSATPPTPQPTAPGVAPDAKPIKVVTAYAFAAKPRDSASEDSAPALQGRIDPNSELGRWRQALLKGGDAGEDALMVSRQSDHAVLIGVADGVGGWTESGIDPAHFSNALLHYATMFAENYTSVPAPRTILEHAFEQVKDNAKIEAGSSTACLVRLDAAQGRLSSANLGDSGFVLLRPDPQSAEGRMQVVFSSVPQLYGFNCPYQLAKVPHSMQQSGSLSNQPSDAALHELDLQRGDMVMVMTDGFLDNVHCQLPPKESLTPDAPQRPELLQLIDMLQDKHCEHWQTIKKPGATASDEKQDFTNVVASTLMQYARLCQMTEEKVSPFQLDAARYGIHYPGGKVDDIALVCATVV